MFREKGVALELTYLMFSENEGKSVQLNYDEKLKLVALTQQATHGKLSDQSEETLPTLGAFDVIGKDRRNAWATLGDLSKEDSMKGFIDGVAESMPHLKAHVEAIKKENESIRQQEDEAQEKVWRTLISEKKTEIFSCIETNTVSTQ